jgi:hypothetical protein
MLISLRPRLSAQRRKSGSKWISSSVVACICIFLSWWVLTALVYHHTPSNFLRAESGWYLFLAQSTPAIQQDFVKDALTKSFHGHYAPFAFLAEFATAKFVGTYAGFWKWRQITVLALLATILFFCTRNSGYALQLSRLKASFSAVGLTAILIFQPQMRDFVAWPFMILQLFWLLFSVTALLSLVQMARYPTAAIWPWLAAAAAYASLHFLGLGLATVAATAAGMAGSWWALRGRTADVSRITAPLWSMIAITTLHAVVMWKFARAEAIAAASPEWQPLSFLTAALGFIPNFVFATLHSLLSTGKPIPDVWQSAQDWPYGVAILLGFGFVLSSAFFRCRREPNTRNRARFILQTFASVSFLLTIALISIRQWHEPSPRGFMDYLSGSRYLILSTFALAGMLAEVLFLLASAPILLSAILSVGLGVCAIVGNLQYAANVYPKISPNSIISHAHAWRSVVALARECQKADLAIPNVPLGTLTQEFHSWDLKLFEPLLRADLKIPPETSLQFAPWDSFSNTTPNEYSRQTSFLVDVRKTLHLEPTK